MTEAYTCVMRHGRWWVHAEERTATDPEDAWQTAEEMYLEERDAARKRGEDTRCSNGVAISGPEGFYATYSEYHWRRKVAQAKLAVWPELMSEWERRLMHV